MCNCNKCGSITLPTSITQGQDGQSINWLGSSASFPVTPNNLDAFYHTGNNISYIYNSTTAQWEVMVQGVASTGATKLLANDVSTVNHTLAASGSLGVTLTDAKSLSFDPTLEGFTVGSIIDITNSIKCQILAAGASQKKVEIMVGNSSNPLSCSPVATSIGSTTVFHDDWTDFDVRIVLTALTGTNNATVIGKVNSWRTGATPSISSSRTPITLDLTQDIHVHSLFTVIDDGSGTVTAAANDYNLDIIRIIK